MCRGLCPGFFVVSFTARVFADWVMHHRWAQPAHPAHAAFPLRALLEAGRPDLSHLPSFSCCARPLQPAFSPAQPPLCGHTHSTAKMSSKWPTPPSRHASCVCAWIFVGRFPTQPHAMGNGSCARHQGRWAGQFGNCHNVTNAC